ncbi:MAG: T9SS type A sorting domain-containing protein [Phycisphaerae bacterium]|nr:T9SS type A sorting domain-containing protein [Saprospiraceae bacterium]
MIFDYTPPFRALAQNVHKLANQLRMLFAVLVFIGVANTAWASSSAPFPGDTTLTATICANETYLFDGQLLNTPGTYTAHYLASDGSDSTVTLILGVLPLLQGNVTASICQGEFYVFNGETYTQTGTYSATLHGSNGCDSIAKLDLTVFPTVITKLKAGICTGTAYIFQGDTLKETGVYSVILSSIHGCDSIVQLQLNVVPFFEIPLEISICDGETYDFGGHLLTDAGVYTDSLTAIGGCDSIVTLTLNILPIPNTTFKIGICEGTSYVFEGDTLSTSDSYVYGYTAANGCDSLVIIELEVVAFFETSAEATICIGETYSFGSLQLTDAGAYDHLFTAIGGCDSTVTLTLTVLPTQTGALQATICDGETYTYHGTPLTEPGLYQFVLTGANGCDSTVTLTLNVLPVPNTSIQASICAGKTYDFNGEILSDEGVYEQVNTASNGCDSIVTLILSVLPLSASQLAVTVCNGETYNFNGEMLDASGTYSQVLAAANGCDSTVTLKLTVLPVLESTLNIAICAGDSYAFDGVLIVDAGTYTATFAGTNACDSTVTLHLEVLPTQSSNVEASICDGTTYSFNGQALTDAGTYTSVLAGANGCDSTVTLVLTVLPTQTTNIDATICQGESYPYFGLNLTAQGTYEYIFQGENNCDSTVFIHLTVLPVPHTLLIETICDGDGYDYNGETLTVEGDYDFAFDAANGCDSLVTLHLTVLPLASTSLAVALCVGLTYEFNGQTLTDSGIYTVVDLGANGCDSTTILELNFVTEFMTNLEATICAGEVYDFNGQMLDTEGVYGDTLTAVGGCDSFLTVILVVLPLSQSTTDASICAGETYSFNGDLLTDAGIYSDTLTGLNGCDSIAVLTLTVLPVQSTSLDVTTCANQPYIFNGLSLGQSGNYAAVLTSENGCDSTVLLNLTVLPIAQTSSSASICAGEEYPFNGAALTQAGTYTATYSAANGCDSIVTLQLTVLPLAQSGLAAVVCEGGPFVYHSQVLTQSGTYTFNFPGAGANGCDSVETLFLTIFPIIPATNTSATVCAGETYLFDGQTLTTSGTYTAELASATGCDSTVVLQLTVLPQSGFTFEIFICEGDSVFFHGQWITDPGNYSEVFININGCDSTVTLSLLVNLLNTNVTLQGGTLIAQATNVQYQWINCATNQPIAGATGSSFTPTVTGQYAVIVTDVNGCSGQSVCQLVQVVSVGEPLSQADWSLQPNPASQLASVMLNEATEGELQVEVYDPAGRLLRQLHVGSGVRQIEIELADFPDGMLLVRLVSERGTSSKMLMKAGR